MAAVKTWGKYGQVYSLNSEKEIDKISGYSNVIFIPTHRIMEWNNRPLVSVNAMIDVGIEEDDDLVIINSDIRIENLPAFKNDGITILTRCDYDNVIEEGRLYEHGFDLYHIPKQFLKIFPPNIYCLGNTWTDYFLPYYALTKGIPVYWPQGKCIFHKTHPFQWDFDEWQFMAEFFKLFFKIDKHISVETMATNILAEIQNRTIK